ncbi:hypothetical protein Y032_0215g2368 [Ancylostoma ceylanicum]|nr:hypothetical protein Y032_0215g2368 [Ancylostoma ceylanicum]
MQRQSYTRSRTDLSALFATDESNTRGWKMFFHVAYVCVSGTEGHSRRSFSSTLGRLNVFLMLLGSNLTSFRLSSMTIDS